MQLVHSPHASGLYSTRVLLTRTTCTADDAPCIISVRIGPLLVPYPPCRHELSRQWYSLCSLWTPRAFTRPGFSLQTQTVPPILQLLQSPDASDLYSTRVPWKAQTVPPMLQLVQWGLDPQSSKFDNPMSRSCSKLPQLRFPRLHLCATLIKTRLITCNHLRLQRPVWQ